MATVVCDSAVILGNNRLPAIETTRFGQNPRENERTLINITNEQFEREKITDLLQFIAGLVTKRERIAQPSLQIIEKEEYRLVIADLARNLYFEVWWHADKREEIREMMMHRVLRAHPVPNVLIADFDFEFNGHHYLLRQKDIDEISLAEYIKDRSHSKTIDLKIDDIINGLKSLHQLWCATGPFLSDNTPILITTLYTAKNTIILPNNKEGGFDFKYAITSDISLRTLYSRNGIGGTFYKRPGHVDYVPKYTIFGSMAEAVELIGGVPDLVRALRRRTNYFVNSIDSILNYDKPHRKKTASNTSTRSTTTGSYEQKPAVVIDEESVLKQVSELMMQRHVLRVFPKFTIKERMRYSLRIADQNDNWFNIHWRDTKIKGKREMMVHSILREEKVPHLITAEFGFEVENTFVLVVRHYNNGITLTDVRTLPKKELVKGVLQMCELFSRTIVHEDHLSALRPVSLLTRNFGANHVWLIPDGTGGFDFKFLVNYECNLLKLDDDGVSVLAYYNEDLQDPRFDLFTICSIVAESIGQPALDELLLGLDPRDTDFAAKVAMIRQYAD